MHVPFQRKEMKEGREFPIGAVIAVMFFLVYFVIILNEIVFPGVFWELRSIF